MSRIYPFSLCKLGEDVLIVRSQQEHARLTSQHAAFIALAGGELIHVPLSSPKKIIDVGCGTGIVTRELADVFPSAEVYGVDLTPVSTDPTDAPSLKFIHGDVMKLAGTGELNWDTFDFLYSRLLVCGLTDWPGYIDRAFRLLKPGGWAQMCDICENVFFDPIVSTRPPEQQQLGWVKALREGGFQKGLDVDAGKNIPQHMKKRGFVDIETKELVMPYWKDALEEMPNAKACYEHHVNDPYALWWHMIPRMVENMGHSQEQIMQWQLDSREDLGEEPGKYQIFYITTARKPELNEIDF